MKNISILGSTGSIGSQTLDVVRNNNDINVVAITAGHNIKLAADNNEIIAKITNISHI